MSSKQEITQGKSIETILEIYEEAATKGIFFPTPHRFSTARHKYELWYDHDNVICFKKITDQGTFL